MTSHLLLCFAQLHLCRSLLVASQALRHSPIAQMASPTGVGLARILDLFNFRNLDADFYADIRTLAIKIFVWQLSIV